MLSDPPLNDPIAVVEDRLQAQKFPKLILGWEYIKWLGELATTVGNAPERKAKVALTGLVASIGVTPLPIASLSAGVWRVSYRFRITRAGTVSSSLQLTLGWTEGGVPISASGAAVVTNTTSSVQWGTFLVRVDGNTPISYSTTYASVGATAMQHDLDLVAEALALDEVAA